MFKKIIIVHIKIEIITRLMVLSPFGSCGMAWPGPDPGSPYLYAGCDCTTDYAVNLSSQTSEESKSLCGAVTLY
jgi:hypothetical protein